LGPIPDNPRDDSREYDKDLSADCQNELSRLQGLKFRRGVKEQVRQKLKNWVKVIYGSANLPLIRELFDQLQFTEQSRDETEYDPVRYAQDTLKRDLQRVKDTAKLFASFERSSASELKQIKRANSLLAEAEADLSKQLDNLIQRYGELREFGSISSVRFEPRDTMRSDISLGSGPAAERYRSLGKVFPDPIGHSSVIGL
jgi:hypothetical protein